MGTGSSLEQPCIKTYDYYRSVDQYSRNSHGEGKDRQHQQTADPNSREEVAKHTCIRYHCILGTSSTTYSKNILRILQATISVVWGVDESELRERSH